MKNRGLTSIEILIIIAILGIILSLILAAYAKMHEKPELIGTNNSGQQTWKVPADSLQDFQAKHQDFKIVSLAPITESYSENARTTAYMIVLEAPKEAEKADKETHDPERREESNR